MDLQTQHGQELYKAALFHFSGLRRNFEQAEEHVIEVSKDNLSSVEDETERIKNATEINELLKNLYLTKDSFDEIVNQVVKSIMQAAYMSGDGSISFTTDELMDLRFVWDDKKRRYEIGTNAQHQAAQSNRMERFFDDASPDSGV